MENLEKDYLNCYARSFPYLIDKTSVYLRLRGANLLNELGADITLEQFITLDAISSFDGICQRDLAKILLKDRSNVTRILNILENKNLIARETSNKGNRVVKVAQITKKGIDVLSKYQNKMKDDMNRFLAQFDSQKLEITAEMLAEISAKISENASIQI